MAVFQVYADGTIGEIGAPTRTLALHKSPAKSLAQARAANPAASSRAVAVATAPRLTSSNTGLPGALAPAKPAPSPATSLAQARPTLTAAPIIAAQAAQPAPTLGKRQKPAEPAPEPTPAPYGGDGSAAAAGGSSWGWGDDGATGVGMTDEEWYAAGNTGPRPSLDAPKDGIPSWAVFGAIGLVLVGGVLAFNAGKF